MPKAKKRAAKALPKMPMPKLTPKPMPRIAKAKADVKVGRGLAIIGLLINLVLPGLGSVLAGKTRTGIWQLLLVVIGLVLTLTIVGIVIGAPLILIAWVWGIVTGVQAIKESCC